MKPSLALFGLCVVVALAGSAFVSAQQPCDPADCGDGPVRAFFQYSNCSGDVTFYRMEENYNWGVCEVQNVVNGFLAVKNFLGFVEMWVYNTPEVTCDPRTPGAHYNYYFTRFGFCFTVESEPPRDVNGRSSAAHPRREQLEAHEAQSYMLLFNAQSSYTSPQNFGNEELPAFIEEYERCYGPDNCTLANGEPAHTWTTNFQFPGADCETPIHSSYNPKLQFNTCTNYNNHTYRFDGCIDEYHTYYAYFTDPLCTIPANGAGSRQSCMGSFQTNNCTGPYTVIPDFVLPFPLPPSPPSPPSGNASFQSVSLLLAFIACIATLVSF